MRFSYLTIVATMALLPTAMGGPISYAICQTGCNTVAVACYAAAGFQFGTILAVAAPATIIVCNSALGTCSAACAGITLLAPIP
ncbi:hypothetical protein EVG20_g1493 [Dentipellis fragilis]|uniref:Cysteine-rich protein n=1 Tax=Dentipellis fragilis TaxID=205917 RepID=A0A4Y9ZC11_9AGAM|nr:hypothetical protein EVG20_g1493 [Dentipellis fragilis]